MKQTRIVILLLLVHSGLLAWSATKHSPNLNEHAHLVAGVSHWKFGRFELYRVNPPLVRMLAALPVLFSDAKFDWAEFTENPGDRPVFNMGKQFIKLNGEKSLWYFTIARWVCIPLSLLGGLICYRWGSELFGPKAGILSLVLWCFSPNILAHGQFFTPDLGATTAGVTAAYFFWRWLQTPSWKAALLAGVSLGFAELTKTTWVILFILWPTIWALVLLRETAKRKEVARSLLQLGCILSLGLYLLNLGYGFDRVFTPLGKFDFVSHSLGGIDHTQPDLPRTHGNNFAETWLGHIPVPFPAEYILGIDVQKKDFENFGRESYLRGHFRNKGWWYYYMYALTIKVPIGYWLLFILSIVHALFFGRKEKSNKASGLMLLIPVITILTLVSSQTGFNHHMRYVLPIFPFAFIWMGQCANWFDRSNKLYPCLVSFCLIWGIGSSLWYYPHSLSYFNELVGGPTNGHKHLINSNIDWGQDLLYLKEWIAEHPDAEPLHVCYYGFLDPADLGIDYPLPPLNEQLDPEFTPPPGWYAISVNYLKGYGWLQPKDAFSYFQKYELASTAGYSIYIYHIPSQKPSE